MRTFISIDIPENIKKEIIKIQGQLPEFEGKLTEKENLHLTLKFLGEVDKNKIEEIKKRLSTIQFKPFETEIDFLGVFSDRIIWLHMTNCEELQKEVDEKLKDLFRKEDRFMSHLTIARVKNIKDKKKFLRELDKIKIPKMKFTIKGFNLEKSKLGRPGPVYEVIEKYKLN